MFFMKSLSITTSLVSVLSVAEVETVALSHQTHTQSPMHPWSHILTSVSLIEAVLREFALHVIDRDDLKHDDPL
jgi:ABC-type arginine transport system permease subunit